VAASDGTWYMPGIAQVQWGQPGDILVTGN
jgi:hypothetical protein